MLKFEPFSELTMRPTGEVRYTGIDLARSVLQHKFLVIANAGNHDEKSEYVWLDVPLVIETEAERKSRLSVEQHSNKKILYQFTR